MTIAEIVAAARAEIAALEPNPICSEAHAAKLLREDALKVFDQMAADVESATDGEPVWSAISSERIAALADGLAALGLYPSEEVESVAVRQADAVTVALEAVKRLTQNRPDYLTGEGV